MTYRIRPSIDAREYERANGKTLQYVQVQRRRGLILDLDNVAVDAEQILLRTFRCNTQWCLRCEGQGAALSYKGSCCTDLQVDLTAEEKSGLIELAGRARRELDLAACDPVKPIVERVLADRFTECNDEGEEVLCHKRNGQCVMAWMDPAGRLRCSINTLTERLGLPIEAYKPDPCYLFPLHYTEYARGRFLLSILSAETRPWIGQHVCVGRLRCLRTPEPGAPAAYQFLRRELEHLLGPAFYSRLDEAGRAFLAGRETAAFSGNGNAPPQAGCAGL